MGGIPGRPFAMSGPIRPFPLPPGRASFRLRLRAIASCVWFGIMPWWVYERVPHYGCTWWEHAAINARVAWEWLTGQETGDAIDFERTRNRKGRPWVLWEDLLPRARRTLTRRWWRWCPVCGSAYDPAHIGDLQFHAHTPDR